MIHSVIMHDIRSAHNVGAILRTCDGFGVKMVYIGGVTPYPRIPDDTRLQHIVDKLTKDIHKTALGAETTVKIEIYTDIYELISKLRLEDIDIIALEQSSASVPIYTFKSRKPSSLLLGSEVEGIEQKVLDLVDNIVEIPMKGHKESFNVSVASGIALYALQAGESAQ